MSQEPAILLVELEVRCGEIGRALKQVGRPAAAIAIDQLAEVFKAVQPLGIVVPAEHVAQVTRELDAAKFPYQVPVFALTKETPGSIRPPLPGITASVPADIDAGILALRLQQALQQSVGPRPRQPTVVGLGDFSRPMVPPPQAAPPISSTPDSAPPSIPSSRAVPAPAASTPAASRPAASSPAASSPPAASKPSAPSSPEVPWDDPSPILSSAPPLPPDTAEKPKPLSGGVVSSAPPLPDFSPPPPAVVRKEAIPPSPPQPSVRPVAPPIETAPTPTTTAPTHPPVAISRPARAESADVDEFVAEAARRKSQLVKRAMAAAGVVAVLGVGAMVLSGEGDGDADASQAAQADPAAASPQELGNKPTEKPQDPSTATAKADGPSPNEADAPASGAKADSASSGISEEGLLYKIEKPIEMESCETALGKTAADFASAKKWRATQSWKLSRRSLMAGKEDDALKHMCESAFIDAAGPAAAGLVKYYLGKRALEQALVWAERAVEATSGGASKRTAQQVLGDVLSQMGKIDEARKVWLESFNLTADQTDRLAPVSRNFVSAAIKARKGGDSALAEQMLRRAAAFSPEDATTAALLADVLVDNEQPGLAERWARRALEKDAGSEMAQSVLEGLK